MNRRRVDATPVVALLVIVLDTFMSYRAFEAGKQIQSVIYIGLGFAVVVALLVWTVRRLVGKREQQE